MKRIGIKGYKNYETMSEEEFNTDPKEHIKQGWKLRTVYLAEDLKLIGKPYATESFLEFRDGSLHEIHSGFVLGYQEDPEKSANQPWFGKVCVLSDGSILNLDTEQVIQKVDGSEFESIRPIDENYVCCFSHDWSAFDVIGAIDESYHAIIRNGVTVIRTSKYIDVRYDENNKPVVTPPRSVPITIDKLDKMYEKVQLEHQFKETLEAMKKIGISKEEVDKMTKYYKAYEETERED